MASSPKLEVRNLALQLITLDPRLQPRTEMSNEVIEAYAESMREGEEFDPVDVFYDGNIIYLAHGYHRYGAKRLADIPSINCTIHEGSLRDAILFSVGANPKGSLPMTNADKRKAVTTLLSDEEWKDWSDNAIADKCNVSGAFVGKVRTQLRESLISAEDDTWNGGDALADEPVVEKRKHVNKHGQVAEIKVAAKPAAEAQDEGLLTDADWLAALPLWGTLGRNQAFVRSALLWRTLHQRGALGQVKNHIARARGDKPLGTTTLERLCSSIMNLRHPRDWQICSGCKGAGCGDCGAGGYVFAGGIDPKREEK